MRDEFEAHVKSRLRDHVYELKQKWINNIDPPVWMKPTAWEGLINFWLNEKNKAKGEINSANRNSSRNGYGTAKHTCGSMPYVRKFNKMVL